MIKALAIATLLGHAAPAFALGWFHSSKSTATVIPRKTDDAASAARRQNAVDGRDLLHRTLIHNSFNDLNNPNNPLSPLSPLNPMSPMSPMYQMNQMSRMGRGF